MCLRVIGCVEGRVGCQLLGFSEQSAVVADRERLELFLHSEHLGYVDEFSVAAVRASEVAVDSDDSLGSWHLHHQVSVMRDCHEPANVGRLRIA